MKSIDTETFKVTLRHEVKPIRQTPYVLKFEDKNGVYSLEDVQSGKLELEK